MVDFLFWIGLYNLLGSVVLFTMHFEYIADWVMRRGTEVVVVPYRHGPFTRLWLWWAASANAFMGAVMMLATRWPATAQREVCIGVIALYGVMYVVCAIGSRKRPPWGRGALSIHVLWPPQIAWGIWAMMS